MKPVFSNQDGIALVTSLLLTLISLTMILAIFYMIGQNIQATGGMKRYKTALDASHGGTDIVMKEILPEILKTYDSATLVTDLQNTFSAVNLTVETSKTCLQDKLTKGASDWNPACSQTINPRSLPDMSLRLQATGGQPYKVYTKIVDTVLGNTDMTGLQLEGAGVAESLTVITPQHLPFVYRVEVQAERESNAQEQANMSVLYAY